jgi:hypothetical protein
MKPEYSQSPNDNVISVIVAPKQSATPEKTTVKTAKTSVKTVEDAKEKLKIQGDELWVVRKLREIRSRDTQPKLPTIVSTFQPEEMKKPVKLVSVLDTTVRERFDSVASPPVVPAVSATESPKVSKDTTTSSSSKESAALSRSRWSPFQTKEEMQYKAASITAVSEGIKDTVTIKSNKPSKTQVVSSSTDSKITQVAPSKVVSNDNPSSLSSSFDVVKPVVVEPKPNLTPSQMFDTFPSVVSEDKEDVLYMAYPTGPVDSHSTDYQVTPDMFKLSPEIDWSVLTREIDNMSASGEESRKARELIRTAGISGTIAYAASEVGFWVISLPIMIVSYHSTTGSWLNFADPSDRV